MNALRKKAALVKFAEQFKTDPESVKESLALDYEENEAKEILEALQPVLHTGTIGESPAPTVEHPHYKWYDEFEARIQKREVLNQYTRKNETIITGWALEKKKQPKFIEPHIAVQLNAFADGFDVLGVGCLLVPKDSATQGALILYQDWAEAQGKDLAKDINILLSKN